MIKISYSGNDLYQRSPRAFFLHYYLKLRPKQVGSALMFGASMDEGLNKLLETKDLAQAKSCFLHAIDNFQYNGKTLTLNDAKFSKADNDQSIWKIEDYDISKTYEYVTLRRKGLMMLDAYMEQVIPYIDIVNVIQKKVEITNQAGDMIRGVIDFIAKVNFPGFEGKTILFDNKTSSMKYKPDSVQTSKQLATYSEVPGSTHDLEGYIVLPKNFRKKKEPLIPIDIIIDKVKEDTVESIFNEYDTTIKGIKAGNFPCNQDNCRKSPFPCPYFKYCTSNCTDTEGLEYYE